MHMGLGGSKAKDSIIHQAFQGELTMDSQPVRYNQDLEIIKEFDQSINFKSENLNFLILSLDLPVQPLFEAEESIIPQIPITTLLSKYNGESIIVIIN
jgi:U4/U6.U5 tri-snRNP-associated protein 2